LFKLLIIKDRIYINLYNIFSANSKISNNENKEKIHYKNYSKNSKNYLSSIQNGIGNNNSNDKLSLGISKLR